MDNNNFLPENYVMPETPSNYMRFQKGINRFRILGQAIEGYEYFTTENKPVRSKEPFETTPSDIKKDGRVKHFWAFPVWNYQTNSIQILELTQKGIMTAVKALVDNPSWGSPYQYDIAVTRTGEGLDTEYSTMPEPKSETSDEIKNAFMEKPINLEKLFTGEDPFAK